MSATEPINRTIEGIEERFRLMRERQLQFETDLQKWLAEQPQSAKCPTHQTQSGIDFEKTTRENWQAKVFQSYYLPCQICEGERKRHALVIYWRDRGIQAKYVGATLDQLRYCNPTCNLNLHHCRAYAAKPKGFLLLLGDKGTGKTHIASAILQLHGKGLFLTQSQLLAKHRATYRDQRAEDMRERCMRTSLLAVDEVGVSVGGRDEEPLIYDILNERYANRLPTILTSNLPEEKLKEALGDRIVDRIQECNFAVLRFCEPSKRAEKNEAYLTD